MTEKKIRIAFYIAEHISDNKLAEAVVLKFCISKRNAYRYINAVREAKGEQKKRNILAWHDKKKIESYIENHIWEKGIAFKTSEKFGLPISNCYYYVRKCRKGRRRTEDAE